MKSELCINCSIPMKKAIVKYRGLSFEGRECPKCHQKIFTEEQAMKAITKLEARRLLDVYIKHPIHIGNSWGITFPKEITEAFNLDKPSLKLKIHPDTLKGKIEIKLP